MSDRFLLIDGWHHPVVGSQFKIENVSINDQKLPRSLSINGILTGSKFYKHFWEIFLNKQIILRMRIMEGALLNERQYQEYVDQMVEEWECLRTFFVCKIININELGANSSDLTPASSIEFNYGYSL